MQPHEAHQGECLAPHSRRRTNLLRARYFRQVLIMLLENDEYEIEDYVAKMEKIIQQKLQAYKSLGSKLAGFKKSLRKEEEVHNMTMAKAGFKRK